MNASTVAAQFQYGRSNDGDDDDDDEKKEIIPFPISFIIIQFSFILHSHSQVKRSEIIRILTAIIQIVIGVTC